MHHRAVSPRSLEPTDVPVCPKCGTSMWLIHIEDDLGRNRRAYECPGCGHKTTINIKHR
jgi:DNA-directed RNA polymerase subunit RPC12/RpoP